DCQCDYAALVKKLVEPGGAGRVVSGEWRVGSMGVWVCGCEDLSPLLLFSPSPFLPFSSSPRLPPIVHRQRSIVYLAPRRHFFRRQVAQPDEEVVEAVRMLGCSL